MEERKYQRNGRLVPGLKIVHIGEEVWKVGKIKNNHCVIYGPNRKEYHVNGDDILLLVTELESNFNPWIKIKREYEGIDSRTGSFINRQGNNTIESNVKIYILTSILDERSNWCFDLTKIPENKKLKVIYNTGTVKNIDFNGVFEQVEVKRKHSNFKYKIYPIGYRI